MTDLHFHILDECYFISSYKNIQENVECEESLLKESIIELLNEQLIEQLHFNLKTNDYEHLDVPDVHSIEKSFFVATKKGLLWHNAR